MSTLVPRIRMDTYVTRTVILSIILKFTLNILKLRIRFPSPDLDFENQDSSTLERKKRLQTLNIMQLQLQVQSKQLQTPKSENFKIIRFKKYSRENKTDITLSELTWKR